MDAIHQRCEIAYGATRVVWLLGNVAIKLPRPQSWKNFLLGLIANMQEREFSLAGWPELCPVLWSVPGGWLVVMRRAAPMSEKLFADFDFDAFVQKGDYYVPVEPKVENLGVLDGRVVAVDYGN